MTCLAVIGGCANYAWTQTECGVVPEYRVTWITDPNSPGPLGFIPDPDLHGTMGMSGEVVAVCYGYLPQGSLQIHAWVWLPEGGFGMDPGWHNIGALQGLSVPNIARGIGGGEIAGQSGGVTVAAPDSTGKATIWKLGSAVTFQTFDPLGGNPGWSGLHAIGESDLAVGDSSVLRPCNCSPGGAPQLTSTGFVLYTPLSSVFTWETPPLAGDWATQAFDFNISSLELNPVVVGSSRCTTVANCQGPPEQVEACGLNGLSLDPTHWVNDALSFEPVAMDRLNSMLGSVARGINAKEEIIGWGATSDNPICFQQASYWPSPDADAFPLGSIMPAEQGTHQSRAEAITKGIDVQTQVVGWNITLNHALLWSKTGPNTDDWMVTDLNHVICCGDWTILQAHAISNHGWVAGFALKPSDAGGSNANNRYAVLLTPLGPCPADITRDGCIDVLDLLEVMSKWGECPPAVICYADTNGDCAVDVVDLLAVNNNWCGNDCPECCAQCPQCQESLAGGAEGPQDSSGPLSLPELIELVCASDATPDVQAQIIEALMDQ